MASVTLTKVWMHDASNHPDLILVWSSGLSEQYTARSSTRAYAAGRVRHVRSVGEASWLKTALPSIPVATLDWLRRFTGRPVMWRDPEGRVLFGVYHQIEVTRNVDDTLDVSLTFDQITWDIEA